MNSFLSYKKFEPFRYKKLAELKQKIEQLKLKIPIRQNVDVLKEKIRIGNRIIPNRLAIQPMEGFDSNKDGTPSQLTYRRYKRYAEGGASMIWFEATAISEDCRSNPHQLVISEKNLINFKKFISSIRETCNQTLRSLRYKNQCVLILQLNHSGRYTKRNGIRYPIRAYHNRELDNRIEVLEQKGTVISDEELEDLEDIWVKKALLAKLAGFDGVDLKACHGYLISELLSSRTRSNSKYGGFSLENRIKFLQNLFKRLNKEIEEGDSFIITSRLGIYDGIPYPLGFGVKSVENEEFPASIDLLEPIELINKLYRHGLRLVNITAGNPHFSPHITRPYDTPIKGANLPPEHPLYSVNRIIKLTSIVKEKIPEDIVLVGSGYSYLRQYAGYVAAGLIDQNMVDICGFGRMTFANPNFAKQIFQNDVIDSKQVCLTCSKCSELMKLGKKTGCVIRDPFYKE
jgi:2,4-dienoyl-CoA reductase-like NADH-dependent reductase (Old Yellow Enzyme family)